MPLIWRESFVVCLALWGLLGAGCDRDRANEDVGAVGGLRQPTAEQLREGKWGPDNGYARIEVPVCSRPIGEGCQTEAEQGELLRDNALRGDLDAQRRLAELFEGGAGFVHRPLQACAWRLVVASAPDNPNPEGDAKVAAEVCASTPPGRERRGAQWLANRIHQRLYSGDLPDRFW